MNLRLSGEVISDDWAEIYRWFGIQAGYYCPGDVRAAIEGLQDGEELVLEINSIGGDVEAAAEIYSVLQKCQNPTRAEIQSLAASAASYLCLACDRVEIALPAQMMIHCASWGIGGNKFDHTWAAEQLDRTDRGILDTYVRKCGEERRQRLQELMEAESFLGSTECLELGLADAIIGEAADGQQEPLRMVAAVCGNVIRAMRTLPEIGPLKEQRDRALREKRQAEMASELEKERSRYQ